MVNFFNKIELHAHNYTFNFTYLSRITIKRVKNKDVNHIDTSIFEINRLIMIIIAKLPSIYILFFSKLLQNR